jgi:hypothetical protein
MPPKKKAKVASSEKVIADIETSNWTIEEYNEIIELCKSKSEELRQEEELSILSALITKYQKASQDKLTELKDEKVALMKRREEEGDESVEDDCYQNESRIEGAINTVSLFSKLKPIELDHRKNVLEYDRNEGDLAYEVIVQVVLECNDKRVRFTRDTKRSSYGGENSTSFSISFPSAPRNPTLTKVLQHWDHCDDWTDEEEWPAFITEMFEDISLSFNDGLPSFRL